ncbi:MAG: glycosyltransferase family 39 protein [Acidobacteria bacterium]|nr:glycosyltransferase family 39 protein [Acidobacteriota bacterium]
MLQIAFYSISWNQFFCGDSLYYLSRRTLNWEEVRANFVREDDVGQYRPLTYPVFSYLLYPLGGLTPRIYHWIGLAIHAAVSASVFWLLYALLQDYGAALAGYCFFALHSTAYFITYDQTFLPDWLFAAFLLPLIACFLSFLRSRRRRFYLAALLLFVLALLSKETAVMAPAVLLCLSMAAHSQSAGGSAAQSQRRGTLRRAVYDTAPFGVISVLYLCLLLAVKGRFYPAASTHPFHVTLDPATLIAKYKLLFWALNIDLGFARWDGWPFLLIYLPQAALATWVLRRLWRDPARRRASAWMLAWGAALLFPVLFLVEPPYPHHLYMPLVAWSGVVGLALSGLLGDPGRRRLLALVFCLNLAASYATLWRFNEKSWVAHGSKVARNFLSSLRRHHPVLAPRSVIHLRKSAEPNSIWYFDRHTLIQLFYDDPSLSMRFEDIGEMLPSRDGPPIANYFVYGLWEGNLDLLADYWKGRSVELLEPALRAEVIEDRSQYYPDFDRFGTPNGRRVFQHLLVQQGERRNTVVTIAGTQVRLPLAVIEPGSWLHVGLSSVYRQGDGFDATLSIERGGQRSHLIRRYLDARARPEDRGWLDYHIDLTPFAGADSFLILQCDAGPQGRTDADWLAWSILRINREPGV